MCPHEQVKIVSSQKFTNDIGPKSKRNATLAQSPAWDQARVTRLKKIRDARTHARTQNHIHMRLQLSAWPSRIGGKGSTSKVWVWICPHEVTYNAEVWDDGRSFDRAHGIHGFQLRGQTYAPYPTRRGKEEPMEATVSRSLRKIEYCMVV